MVWVWSKGLVTRHVWELLYGVWLGLIELLLKSYPLCANILVRCVRTLR